MLSVAAGMALTSMCFFLYNQEYEYGAMFLISGVVTSLFTKNMIVVFCAAVLFTHAFRLSRTRNALKYWTFPGARSNVWREGMTDGTTEDGGAEGEGNAKKPDADPSAVAPDPVVAPPVTTEPTPVAAPTPEPVPSNNNDLKLNAIQDRLDDIQATIYKLQKAEAAKEAAAAAASV